MIHPDVAVRRNRPRRDQDPSGDRRRGSQRARLGSSAHPHHRGGRPDVAAEMEAALRDAAKAAEVEPAALAGVGGRIAGDDRRGQRDQRSQPPRLGGHIPAGADARTSPRLQGQGGQRRSGRDRRRVQAGAGRLYSSLLGVFWGTGVGGGLILDGKPWTGRGAAGEIGHMVVEIDGARCTCGRRGCMEAYAGRAAMEEHVRQAGGEGQEDRPVQADEGARAHAPDERHLGAGARARRQAGDPRHRPRGQGARRRDRLGRQPARRRGRDHRRRAGHQARPSLCQADRRGDAAAPVRRLPTAARPRGGARRSRRGDRGRAAGPLRRANVVLLCHSP